MPFVRLVTVIAFVFSFVSTLSGQQMHTPDKSVYCSTEDDSTLYAMQGINPANSQKDTAFIAFNSYDKIITKDKKVFLAEIQNITLHHVRFKSPNNSILCILKRNEISQIHYANGKIEVFTPLDEITEDITNYINESKVKVKYTNEWENIKVFYDDTNMEGLEKRDNIIARFKAGSIKTKNQHLEKNALIILKKKAANLGGNCILITDKTFNRDYGELPSIKIKGTVYCMK